jgi:hypothetical protein
MTTFWRMLLMYLLEDVETEYVSTYVAIFTAKIEMTY